MCNNYKTIFIYNQKLIDLYYINEEFFVLKRKEKIDFEKFYTMEMKKCLCLKEKKKYILKNCSQTFFEKCFIQKLQLKYYS